MFSLTINQLLEAFESHMAQTGDRSGEARLYFTEDAFYISSTENNPYYRNLLGAGAYDRPLNYVEEKRLKALDRKAKGGLLSGAEDEEFEALLAIQQFFQSKTVQGFQEQTRLEKRA